MNAGLIWAIVAGVAFILLDVTIVWLVLGRVTVVPDDDMLDVARAVGVWIEP